MLQVLLGVALFASAVAIVMVFYYIYKDDQTKEEGWDE